MFGGDRCNIDQTSSAEVTGKKACFEKIVSSLVSAGYNRASDSDLSDFDKVVGGLCWAITASLIQVDVDILFEENSRIKERIKLSEDIVDVLRQMKCAHDLSAHQIQGSDFVNILPVIQWLLKKVIEVRGNLGEQLKTISKFHFSKDYEIGDDVDSRETQNQLVDLWKKHQIRERKLRFTGDEVRRNTEESKVHACLLEYGESMRSYRGLKGAEGGMMEGGVTRDRSASSTKTKLSGFDKQLADAQRKAEEEEEALLRQREDMANAMMKNMESAGGVETAEKGAVGNLVGLRSSKIGAAQQEYEKQQEEIRKLAENANSAAGQAAALKRKEEALRQQLEEARKEAKQISKIASEKRGIISTTQAKIDEMANMNARILEETEKLMAIERNSDQKDELKKLWSLVQKNEKLKKQEKEFKDDCKKKMAALQSAIKTFDSTDVDDEEEIARMREVEVMHEKTLNKHGKIRQLLAQRNLQVASTSRMIDDVPTRTELIQYERRFVELYQQVALKLEETRKYYATYNTLDNTRNYLAKEVKLIDSITNNFENAMRTKASQEEFLLQFETIIKSVEDSLVKQNKTLDSKRSETMQKENEYMNIVDEQRKYFKAVKDFQDECQKNEMLSTKLEDLGV